MTLHTIHDSVRVWSCLAFFLSLIQDSSPMLYTTHLKKIYCVYCFPMLGNGTSKFHIKTRINAIGNYQLETHGNGSYYEIS